MLLKLLYPIFSLLWPIEFSNYQQPYQDTRISHDDRPNWGVDSKEILVSAEVYETGNRISLSVQDQIADELQKQIDLLRKQLKELESKFENSTTPQEIDALKEQFNDLHAKLQDCYKKIDQLGNELKQEFKQRLDELQKEVVDSFIKLSDRVTDLESEIQKLTVNQCIGFLRDGSIQTAALTLQSVKNPVGTIAHIVSNGYQKVATRCGTVVSFINAIELDDDDNDEVRALAYTTLYSQLAPDQFTSEGVPCTYNLAWHSSVLFDEVRIKREIEATQNYLRNLISKLPDSFRIVTSHGLSSRLFQLDVNEKNRCTFDNHGVIPKEPEHQIVPLTGEEQWTNVTSDDGEWFGIRHNYFQGPLQYTDVPGGTSLAQVATNEPVDGKLDDTRLWKLIAVSNSQVNLLNKASTLYLSAMAFTSTYPDCAMYLVKNETFPFYVHFLPA